MNIEYTGKKISSLRKEKGMTQRELAERLNITDKAVSKWERGLNYPDLSLFQSLAHILDTSVSELLGVEQDIPSDTIPALLEVSKQEKKQTFKKVREYFQLTIFLCIAIVVYKLYLSVYGYDWERFNTQFWIEGVIIALSATLITNGIHFLMQYKKYSKDI
ncbi:MAG: helix-turn-helix transcriptional regulator [Hespellia sp.]|nr:helix-turn-helix transcriptional regulator [Hespellia sp.]